MKTLADLKRAMIIGSKWEAVHYNGFNFGVREIRVVRSKEVGFRTERGNISWVDFPKASDMKIVNGWVEFWQDWYVNCQVGNKRVPLIKYKQIK